MSSSSSSTLHTYFRPHEFTMPHKKFNTHSNIKIPHIKNEAFSSKILHCVAQKTREVEPMTIDKNIKEVEMQMTNMTKDMGKEPKTTHNIVFVTSEAAPYSKTGGLGDVCGSLPIALAARGHRVMVVSPRYLNGALNKNYDNAYDLSKRINISCFEGLQEIAYFHEYRAGVDWVYIHFSLSFLQSTYIILAYIIVMW